VRDVARGVHDAHLRNVFHRDLKPHNVLITPISRRAKIADFGLAVSAAGPPGWRAASRNGALRIAGTPGYLAPEQARDSPSRSIAHRGRPRRAGRRRRLGLGAIAYDLLAGHPPWHAADGIAPGSSPPAGPDRRRSIARPTAAGSRAARRIVERALAADPRSATPAPASSPTSSTPCWRGGRPARPLAGDAARAVGAAQPAADDHAVVAVLLAACRSRPTPP